MMQRPALAASADRWAAPFLLGVLLLAGIAAAAWSVIEPARAVWVVVSVLIVTCPCALSLAAPSALLAASGQLARRGVLLRRPDALDAMARVQTLFIDKTGTLTEAGAEGAQMVRTGPEGRWSDAVLRGIASSLAAWSTHPLARALARDATGQGATWVDLQEIPGHGLQGRAGDGSVWCLGKGPTLPLAANDAAEMGTWLSCDGAPVACFRFVERLRADAVDAVRALQRDGVRVALLSGDTPARVERVGRRLGLPVCRGGMSPQDKLDAVRAAQARGERVAMLGDGINDAPVLAQADTSLAMGEGAQIARAQADGVLVSNALQDVVNARALAKRTLRVVRQNFAWAAAYNAACVPLALLGWLPPWAAGLGMASSSLVVVLNSLRLAR
jgi:Cu2+-exporting ATPase